MDSIAEYYTKKKANLQLPKSHNYQPDLSVEPSHAGNILKRLNWLVGCFGFNGPLRQYFSLYRAVSQREGERRARIDESKNVQTTPTRTYCKRNRPLPYCNQDCKTPRHGSLPSTIAPPDHPLKRLKPQGLNPKLLRGWVQIWKEHH